MLPENASHFDDQVGAVEHSPVKDGRSALLRRFRQEEDAALLYLNFVVSELLQRTRSADMPGCTCRTTGRRWACQRSRGTQPGDALGLPDSGSGVAQCAAAPVAGRSGAATVSR